MALFLSFAISDPVNFDDSRFGGLPIGDWLTGTPLLSTSTAFTISQGSFRFEYHGVGFTYDTGCTVGGTITELHLVDLTTGRRLIFSDFSMSVEEFRGFVDRGDSQDFLSCVLGGNDRLFGTAAFAVDELLDGFAGDDLILGEGGDDTLRGGIGNDTLRGEDSSPFFSDEDHDSLLGGAGCDFLTGGAGRDTLDGGTGDDTMYGGDGDDVYVVDSVRDVVCDSSGTDRIESSVSLDLGSFTNSAIEHLTLTGSGAINGAGNGLGNTIIGNSAANKLQGHDGNDSLLGEAGDDTLEGGTGADTLRGGLGRDTLQGGAGNDVYDVDDHDTVSETLAGAEGGLADLVRYGGNLGSYVLGANLEHLDLHNDAVSGTGNALNNRITGNDGNNILSGLSGADTLFGGGGDDTLDGGTGNDTMDGGDGEDFFIVNSILDVVRDSGGFDQIASSVSLNLDSANVGDIEGLVLTGHAAINGTGDARNNLLIGNGAANRLNGAAGRDSLSGGEGNDTLDGGTGVDTMSGGLGNDVYFVDDSADLIAELAGGGPAGADTVFSSASTYTLSANLENLTLVQGAGNIDGNGNELANKIAGNDGANRLNGGDGNDTLIAGIGNDWLSGGAGDDVIVGGTGRDVFSYESVLDGHDLILGFDAYVSGGQDTLDLDRLFDALCTTTADRAGRVQITDVGGNVELRIDTDGNGTFELFAATLETAGVVTVGEDVMVGTL